MLPGPARRLDRRRDLVETVDEKDNVGGFGGRGGTLRAHGDAEIGGGKGRGVVDAVADHHHGPVSLLGLHDGDLPVRREIGMNRVEMQTDGDRLRHVVAVTRGHDDAGNPQPTKAVDHLSGLRAQGIRQDQEPGGFAIDCHGHHDRPDRIVAVGERPGGLRNTLRDEPDSAYDDAPAIDGPFQLPRPGPPRPPWEAGGRALWPAPPGQGHAQ